MLSLCVPDPCLIVIRNANSLSVLASYSLGISKKRFPVLSLLTDLPFQVLGKGKERRSLENEQLLLTDVKFENNGWPDTTRFGGAMLICIESNIDYRDMKGITLYHVSFRNCSAKFGAAIFAATIEQGTAPSRAYREGGIFTRHEDFCVSRKTNLTSPLLIQETTVTQCLASGQGGMFAFQIGINFVDG